MQRLSELLGWDLLTKTYLGYDEKHEFRCDKEHLIPKTPHAFLAGPKKCLQKLTGTAVDKTSFQLESGIHVHLHHWPADYPARF